MQMRERSLPDIVTRDDDVAATLNSELWSLLLRGQLRLEFLDLLLDAHQVRSRGRLDLFDSFLRFTIGEIFLPQFREIRLKKLSVSGDGGDVLCAQPIAPAFSEEDAVDGYAAISTVNILRF